MFSPTSRTSFKPTYRPPPDTRPFSGCSSCKKPMYGQVLVCGKCRLTPYCSKQCQTVDWPKHKARCKTLRSAYDSKSTDSVAIITSRLKTDTFKYQQSMSTELHIAARSAFQFGSDWGDERRMSDFLQLEVDYEPNGTTLRARFVNPKVSLQRMKNLGANAKATMEHAARASAEGVEAMFGTGDLVRPADFASYHSVLCVTSFRGTPDELVIPAMTPKVLSPTEHFSTWIGYSPRKPNPHWAAALERSLATVDPRPSSILAMEDLALSEGVEKAKKIVKDSERQVRQVCRDTGMPEDTVVTFEERLMNLSGYD